MPQGRKTTDANRDQILDAAADVFARKGFNKASVDDVVTASGLSKGTVYWHYKSKDGLLAAVMERIVAVQLRKMDRLSASQGSVTEGLLAFVRQFARDLKRIQALMPLALDFYAMARRKAWVRQLLQAYLDKYRAVFASIIEEGMRRKEFRPVSAEDAAVTLTALIEGLILIWTVDSEAIPLEHHATVAFEMVFRGLSTEPGSWMPEHGEG